MGFDFDDFDDADDDDDDVVVLCSFWGAFS